MKSFGETPVKWNSIKEPLIPESASQYADADLIILDEKAEFHFYGTNNEFLIRNLVFKINTAKGLEKIQTIRLPESFDEAYDANFFKQGRAARNKIPYISEYRVKKFGARKYSSTKWETVSFKIDYEKIRWIKFSGEFINDEIRNFQLQGLSIGDVVEISYESEFNSSYGSNLFYFYSAYPKLKCDYEFLYTVSKRFADHTFILPININDSCIKRTYRDEGNYLVFSDKINLVKVSPINYPNNAYEANSLPHVFADFRFFRILTGTYHDDSRQVFEYDLFRPRNFEWMIYSDTINDYTKIYNKQFAALRKFATTLPTYKQDSSFVFFKALCDTFNQFRYISSNQLFYNESALYDLYSGEQLLKRRLIEHSLGKLYTDLLNDQKIFYYRANVLDRRYGEHNLKQRAHYAYEHELIAVPLKNTFLYFMPRFKGLTYHLNELPFYLEGSLAALSAKNIQEDQLSKEDNVFRIIRTHKGTSNENTRTENASVKISLDSLHARLTIKESLSGQFSTILRHYYLNEYIDSTLSSSYFKKCTDKPGASFQRIKLSSKVTEFPFRYSFNCFEQLKLKEAGQVSVQNWFSFLLSQFIIKTKPSHDYYFDFDFSDVYNFSFDFDKDVTISNLSEFKNTIDNEYFNLESEIIKNSSTNYLMKVKLVVKQMKVPAKNSDLLMNLVSALDKINSFSMILVKG